MISLSKCLLLSLVAALVIPAAALAQESAGEPRPERSLDEVVDAGLEFLRKAQNNEGQISPRVGSGVTSLAVTAALRHGRPLDDPLVARGLSAIEGFVQPDGGIYASDRLRNYETCVAIVCLVEANKRAGDGRYDEILKNAENFVRGLQIGAAGDVDEDDPHFGGVGYGGPERPDLSNTTYLLEALRALDASSSDPAIQRAIAFVSRCQNLKETNDTKFGALVDDGGFYYVIPTENVDPSISDRAAPNGGLRSYGSMTYSGFKSLIYAGLTKDDPRTKAALEWIQKNYTLEKNPGQGLAGLFYYYHTFGSALAASQLKTLEVEGEGNRDWKQDLIAHLTRTQRPDGSWVNTNRQWFEDDPNLCTSFALLSLAYARPAPENPAGE